MKFSTVFHTGTVMSINMTTAKVALDSTSKSECGACAMATFCGKNDDTTTVEASIPAGMEITPGTKVRITSENDTKSKANIMLLAIPTFAFTGGIFAATLAGVNEAGALAAGTLACLLCFFALRITNGRRRLLWRVTQICD